MNLILAVINFKSAKFTSFFTEWLPVDYPRAVFIGYYKYMMAKLSVNIANTNVWFITIVRRRPKHNLSTALVIRFYH